MGIDQYAYASPLRSVHPGEKALLTLLTLLVVLGLDSILVSGVAFISISLLLLGPGRVAGRIYLGLLLIPLLFLLLGCVTIAVTIQPGAGGLLASLPAGPYRIGLTPSSLEAAVILFWRCLACVACMYFLALTTPVTQIVLILKKLRLPSVLVDVMSLIYYAIFDFLAAAAEIGRAQKSRCGYDGFKASLRSLAALSFQMFSKFLHQSDQTYDALVARGFSGSLAVLEEEFEWRRCNLAAIIGFNLVLVMVKNLGVAG